VATVDNLSREHIAQRVNVTQPIGGLFVVSGKDDTLAIGPKNTRATTPWSRGGSGRCPEGGGAYVYCYPLFQQAFVELGIPTPTSTIGSSK
jgi:hypothetical protein